MRKKSKICAIYKASTTFIQRFDAAEEKRNQAKIKRKINDSRPLQSVPILILIFTDKSGPLVMLRHVSSVKTGFWKNAEAKLESINSAIQTVDVFTSELEKYGD